MRRVLGLDLGTNSIGWAIVDRNDDYSYSLVDRGVHIFQEGVAREKGMEKPAVQDRTEARSSRRHYFRRRLRKIELLKVLVENGFCPYISHQQLADWKLKKTYPLDDAFMQWQRTDQSTEGNPYYDRYLAITKKLDLEDIRNRYIIGRALYHLNQRRGFLSGRKDSNQDTEDGKVKQCITGLSEEMSKAGCHFLGEYFYQLFQQGKKIRTRYTSREEHYLAEFNEICRKQELPDDLRRKLERAIFYQRPLKSQKGTVGKCPFEKDKPRCPLSHPSFEEFRMLQFLNGIRILSPDDEDFRPLNGAERAIVFPLFFRKTKPHFAFDELAAKISGKKNWSFRDDSDSTPYKFNYRAETLLSGCPVTASILSAAGLKYTPDWAEIVSSMYAKGDGKTVDQIVNDIWHALFSFSDAKLLSSWLQQNLLLDKKSADTLASFPIPQGYANLSLKAIRRINPWLRDGCSYSHAVFYANLDNTLPESVKGNPDKKAQALENVRIILEDADNEKEDSKYKEIVDYLFSTGEESRPERLYQPSVIDIYPKSRPDSNGKYRLGSPRTDAFRNPMAQRALFRLRILVNDMLDKGKIDQDTQINIEFARELNDHNKRRAIELFQKENEKARAEARKAIQDELGIEPTETDVLKYILWEEQGHKCLYTGEQIGIIQFIGGGNVYDIEHTVPRSAGGDDSQANKTLCNNVFNRKIKGAQLPSELINHEAILANVEFMKQKADTFDKRVYAAKKAQRSASTKEQKDRAIQDVHLNRMRRDYWRSKYERFTMKTVPAGFSNRQGGDIGIIGKYARMYLNSVFSRIYIVKGATTADFRKAWGLQDEYSKKERVNHVHHCIDAITIACIGKTEYDNWKWYMEKTESYHFGKGPRLAFKKPWKTFTEDVLAISDVLMVSHYTPDNMAKRSRKKMRVRGQIQRNQDGNIKYCQGDTARRSLHKDTFYGAISREDSIFYVIRKSLDSLEEKDVKNIVDDVVREIVTDAIKKSGSLKKAVADGIWMNEEKGIPIHKVRLYAPSVVYPISLKRHRDESRMEHKRSYYVMSDGNYCMAVYGYDSPSFKLFSAMDAARYLKEGRKESDWIPATDERERPLRFVLKIGTMVLLYENSPEELRSCTQASLSKRLYKVTGLSSMRIQRKYHYGNITLKHHQEARLDTELDISKGVWVNDAEYRPKMVLSHTQLTILVEGKDFKLTVDGKVVLETVSSKS